MMTDEQKSKAARLKTAMAGSEAAMGGASREVRIAALKLKEELRLGGTTARELAGALGIHETTLCRWQRGVVLAPEPLKPVALAKGSRGRGASFRVVQVADAADTTRARASASLSGPTTRSLRVAHAPSGLVIDGLDVESLAALLRRMS